jgi:hypothetical protein
MAICGCGLPACRCQPAVAGGVIYADLRSELSTHLAPQALFTQSSPVCDDCHCYKLSPFQAHWGRWHSTRFLRPACLFTAHVGGGSSPLSCGVFLPLPLQAFPLLIAGLPPSPARPGLFIYSSGRDSPPPLLGAQGTLPSLQRVFIVLIAYYSVSLSPLGGGRSAQGTMLIWPRVVCGSTMYRLTHLVICIFLSHLDADDWRTGALLVSPFNVKWRFSAQAGGVEGSKFCLFSVALPARCVSRISPRFHFRRHAFCFLPLAAILESLL